MLKSELAARGHEVTAWSPVAKWQRRFAAGRYAKWAGYIDQYVVFPRYVRSALNNISPDTLFVFCDQALGPWVPLVKSRPHVVHVHDLLALRSALGEIKENPTSWSGRIYQRFIRHGFRQARHFISVSKKTRDDLERYGEVEALSSDVVYNGLNYPYTRLPRGEAEDILRASHMPLPARGMLLHIGGSQWYKNQPGVIAIYARYVADTVDPLPLWCIGPEPNAVIRRALTKVGPAGRVLFFQNVSNRSLQAAYSCARAFLMPSLAEGFGWPLVEAEACGCPVITTNEPPMSEVAGEAAFYLPRLEFGENLADWGRGGAAMLEEVLSAPADNLGIRLERGRTWANNFKAERSIEAYLAIYAKILDGFARKLSPNLTVGDSDLT